MNIYEKQWPAGPEAAFGAESARGARSHATRQGPTMAHFVETCWLRYDLLHLDRDCVRQETERRA